MAGERLRASGIHDAELLHPSNYLKKEDLQGKDVTVTIEDIEPGHELAKGGTGKKEKKPVLFFVGKAKMMVLNKENKTTLVELYGGRVADWIGKRITLWNDPSVKFGGRRVGGLRIRPTTPPSKEAAKPAPGPAPDPVVTSNQRLVEETKQQREATKGQLQEELDRTREAVAEQREPGIDDPDQEGAGF